MPRGDHARLAARFAPVFSHKVSDEWRAADQFTRVDFAGPLTEIAQNPKKLFALDPNHEFDDPTVYYSVCETTTHCFFVYAVYHPFDWWKRVSPTNLYDAIRDRVDEHAHDMEGALVVVRKVPERIVDGRRRKAELVVDGLVTVSHRDFYLYTQPRIPIKKGRSEPAPGTPSLRVVKFNETVDGTIWLDKDTGRIKLYVQSRGHGIRGDHNSWGGGSRVWYYRLKGIGGDPSELNNDDETHVFKYELEDLFKPKGLWDRRYDEKVFRQAEGGQWGFTCFDKLTKGKLVASSANPPWGWNDHNDPSPIGEIATNPAWFITRYAQGWGPVSQKYMRNPYLEIGKG
jgi:hypothetical protein